MVRLTAFITAADLDHLSDNVGSDSDVGVLCERAAR